MTAMPGAVRGDDQKELINCWNTRADEWQPIETFDPGPNNPNVLVVDQGVVSEAYYNGESDQWFKAGKSEHDFDFVNSDRLYPTHWMPLPAPPEEP